VGFVAALLPLACPGCGAVSDGICPTCRVQARPAPELVVPHGLDALAVAFAYEGTVRNLVARLKYRGAHASVGWLAAVMADVLGECSVDVVTWAPTTSRRRRQRGYDQAQLLARALAHEMGVRTRSLLRRTSRSVQTGRSAPDRQDVAFVAAAAVPARVLLVDDVVTTGATLGAASAALRANGAHVVIGAAAARTP